MTATRQAQVALAVCALATGASAQTDVTPLPQLTVEVSQGWCPADASADARSLMATASELMGNTASLGTVQGQGQGVIRTVPVHSVGRQPVPRDVPAVTRGSTARGRARWIDRFKSGTFAVPLGLSSLDGRFEAWEYAPLLRG